MKNLKENIKEKIIKTNLIILFIIIFCLLTILLMNKFNIIEKKYYKASDFKIKTIYSDIDYDKDALDDYTEFLIGSKKSNNILYDAFNEAGYNLENIIDGIKYKDINDFLEKTSVELDTNPNNIEEFQPGDILIFKEEHYGIVSDKRNKEGITYVIHNFNQTTKEEDILDSIKIIKHYRFQGIEE